MTAYTSFHRNLHNSIRTQVAGLDWDYSADPQGDPGGPPTVLYDNDGRDQPSDDRCWVNVSIRPNDSRQIAMGDGTRYFRHSGILVFQVYQRLGTGTASSAFLCDRIASKFRGVTVSGVTYQTPVVGVMGNDDGGQWFKMNVRVPWYSDDSET